MRVLSTDDNHYSVTGDGQPAVPQRPVRPYWIAAIVVIMGAVWLWGGMSLPQGARYAAVGPGLMVTVVGIGLIVLGLVLALQIWRGESFEPQDAEDAAANAKMDKVAFLTALAAAVLPLVAISTIGMPLTATLCFVLVCRSFGSRKWPLDLVWGLLLACLAWYLFTRLGLQLGRFFPPLYSVLGF
jgi:putative tricarboxylic transport membrane protein